MGDDLIERIREAHDKADEAFALPQFGHNSMVDDDMGKRELALADEMERQIQEEELADEMERQIMEELNKIKQ